MRRSVTSYLIAALSALAASACTVGFPSAIDAAPFASRMASAPFPDGVYCGVDEGDNGGLFVKTVAKDGGGNCASFSWDNARRVSTATDT